MTENTVVRAHIDERCAGFDRPHGVFCFRMTMTRIAHDKALPFKPLVPNEETIEAMRAARRG